MQYLINNINNFTNKEFKKNIKYYVKLINKNEELIN